ncbi:MAG: M23 family metallopeptidase, partial [Acidobacteriota bacterium]
MLRKRYYILFVARDEDGQIHKIPLPLRYAYIFVAAAVVGTFTIVGLAGSYTRMLLKTESYNQVRQERETLRKDYQQMARIAHDRTVQVSSLGALASEVSTLYGLRQGHLPAAVKDAPVTAVSDPTPASLGAADELAQQQFAHSVTQFYALRNYALSGRISRALEDGLSPTFTGDWTELADAPSMWPIEGRVASSFGEREDPFNGEGAFHSGIDIDAPYGSPVRATGDGDVVNAGRE